MIQTIINETIPGVIMTSEVTVMYPDKEMSLTQLVTALAYHISPELSKHMQSPISKYDISLTKTNLCPAPGHVVFVKPQGSSVAPLRKKLSLLIESQKRVQPAKSKIKNTRKS